MPEPEAGSGTQDWEKIAKDHQAAYTRAQQEAAGLRQRLEEAQEASRRDLSDRLRGVASTDPDAAREWAEHMGLANLGARDGGDNRSGGTAGRADASAAEDGYDDSVYDPQSPAYQRFAKETVERELRRRSLRRMAPELRAELGLDAKTAELEQRLAGLQAELAATREAAETGRNYGLASWDETRMIREPWLGKARQLHQKLTNEPGYWEHIAELEEAYEKAEAAKARPPAASPKAVGATIARAQEAVAGGGPGTSAPAGRPDDPFDAAVIFAQEHAAAR